MTSLSVSSSPTLQAKTCSDCPHPNGGCPVAKKNVERKAGEASTEITHQAMVIPNSPRPIIGVTNFGEGTDWLAEIGLMPSFTIPTQDTLVQDDHTINPAVLQNNPLPQVIIEQAPKTFLVAGENGEVALKTVKELSENFFEHRNHLLLCKNKLDAYAYRDKVSNLFLFHKYQPQIDDLKKHAKGNPQEIRENLCKDQGVNAQKQTYLEGQRAKYESKLEKYVAEGNLYEGLQEPSLKSSCDMLVQATQKVIDAINVGIKQASDIQLLLSDYVLEIDEHIEAEKKKQQAAPATQSQDNAMLPPPPKRARQSRQLDSAASN